MLPTERRSIIPMLAGSLFAMGLPCLWYAFSRDLRIVPLNMISFTGLCNWWSAGFIVAGLTVLAVGIWLRAHNPYGYFAFGLLIASVGLFFNLFSELLSYGFFALMLCYYLFVFIRPRSANDKQPHTKAL